MYYKAFTNNGDFHVGYLFNITELEELRRYSLWAAKKQFNDDEIGEEDYTEMKSNINGLDLSSVAPKKDGEQALIDGFVEELFVTASSHPFPKTECEDFQRSMIGNAPWHK